MKVGDTRLVSVEAVKITNLPAVGMVCKGTHLSNNSSLKAFGLDRLAGLYMVQHAGAQVGTAD